MEQNNPIDMVTPPTAPSRSRHPYGLGWYLFVSLLGPAIAGVAVLLVLLGALSIFSGSWRSEEEGVDEAPDLEAVWSYGHGTQKVVRIPIKGVLMEGQSEGLFAEPDVVANALREIQSATRDEEVKAIIVEIDSPGGGITASDLLREALMNFKDSQADRKVVALLGDLAASGGFYVATAADYIIAHPTTLTGSFGVLISKLNIKGLGDQYGVKMETVKSGANKDLLSPFEYLTEEQRALLQGVVDEMQNRFVALIVESRDKMTETEVRSIADGRVFSATKALEYKVIDEIGYWEDAVARTSEMLGVDDVKVLKYSPQFSLSSLLSAKAGSPQMSRAKLEELTGARLMYMWQAW